MKNKNNILTFIKHNYLAFILLFIIVFIIFSWLLLNDIIINIRLLELRGYLQRVNRDNTYHDFLGILSQYKLYKDWYNDKISERQMELKEMNVSYIINTTHKQQELYLTKYSRLSQPVIFVLNKMRKMQGHEPIEELFKNFLDDYLILAYYYERNKKFYNALYVYQEAIDQKRVNDAVKPVIFLHQGFCFSIIGEYSQAKDKYLFIINNYKNEEVAVIAAILLGYLEGFQTEIRKVKASKEDSLVKSTKLIKLIAYKDALEILDTIETKDKKQKEKIKFYKARCFEELGNQEESVKNYQEIIIDNHQSEYAKQANRRMLIIASNNKEGDELKKLTVKNNELIKDDEYSKLLNISKKINFKHQEENKAIEKLEEKTEKEEPQKELALKVENQISKEELKSFINNSYENMEEKIKTEKKKVVKKTPIKKKPIINKEKKLIKRVEYSQTTDTTQKKKPYTIFWEDKNGTIYRVEKYDENDLLTAYYIYEYDRAGNPIGVKSYDGDGNLIR